MNEFTPQEKAVLAPIHELFDSIAKRDRAGMLRVVLPEGGATLIRHNQIFHFTLKALVERPFPDTPEPIVERIYDPLIRIDDNIAVVWARYEVFLGGNLDHWGTNLINLVLVDGKWLITGVLDNSRRNEEAQKPLKKAVKRISRKGS